MPWHYCQVCGRGHSAWRWVKAAARDDPSPKNYYQCGYCGSLYLFEHHRLKLIVKRRRRA